jgi:hypothetical protein
MGIIILSFPASWVERVEFKYAVQKRKTERK